MQEQELPKIETVTPRQWVGVIAGLLGAFLAIIDITITNTSIKELTGAFSLSEDEASWISTSYLVAEIIAIAVTAWLIEVLGIRRYLLWSVILFLISSVGCTLANSLNTIVIARVCQGLSGGALIPIALSLMSFLLPKSKQPIGMSLFGLIAALAPTLGGTLGGWLTQNFSWEYIFYINLIPGLILIPMIFYSLDTDELNKKAFLEGDWLGILLISIGLASLLIVLEQGNQNNWFQSSLITLLLVISIVSLTYFTLVERKAKKPLIDLNLFKDWHFLVSLLIFFVFGFYLLGVMFVIPLYLEQVHDYNPLQVGEVIMWMVIPQIICAPLIPKLIKYIPAQYIVFSGFLILSMSSYANIHMSPNFAGDQMIPSIILRGMGIPFIIIPIQIIAFNTISKDKIDQASVLVNMSRNLGSSFGIAIIQTMVTNLSRANSNSIKSTVSSLDQNALDYVQNLQNKFIMNGFDSNQSHLMALNQLNQKIQLNASIIAYNDIYFTLMVLTTIAGFLVFLNKPKN